MKLLSLSLKIFFCGIYSDLKTKRLGNVVAKHINAGEPICSMKIVNLSESCYKTKRKIAFLEKRFKSEIEKRRNM